MCPVVLCVDADLLVPASMDFVLNQLEEWPGKRFSQDGMLGPGELHVVAYLDTGAVQAPLGGRPCSTHR